MKLSQLIVAALVVLSAGACSRQEESTTSMDKTSKPATRSSTGAMEVIKQPEGKAPESAADKMQEPAEPAHQP